jgi:small nuclear ribonucleoprotein (snRNP)-like protein
MEAPQSPYLERQTSNSSAYKNLVQPAVTHLVSKTKKKRTTGLPADFRKRQNLVQLKHDKALAMLRPWLLEEKEGKIYLRGDDVAFIQVKCPKALQAVDAFLERILNDESIEIVQCTSPLSRKRQGQLKGYLLYLKCRTAANVARINEIYEQDFADSGLKCKTARFEKKQQQQQEQQRVSLEASSSESSTEESAL